MSKPARLLSAVALGAALVGLVGAAPAPAQTRGHSGLVVSVNPGARTLVVRELAELGKSRELSVRIPPSARVVLSERLPDAEVKDFAQAFRDTPIDVKDLRPGDYVVIESTREKDGEVASQVIVTLRGSSG